MTDRAASQVDAYIAAIEHPHRQQEARALRQIFDEVTGFSPRLWSGRMIGYGSYAYTYATGRSGVCLATGFAVGKAHLTIYVMPGYAPFPAIMNRLGKHKSGKSCLYLTRLEHADGQALRDLIGAGLDDLATRWTITPS